MVDSLYIKNPANETRGQIRRLSLSKAKNVKIRKKRYYVFAFIIL